MDCVLDLDLDFFVWPIVRDIVEERKLSQDECEFVHSGDDVRKFLEEHCGLDARKPLPGQRFSEHVDAFKVWRRWLSQGTLKAPFDVVHVDAHGDFGSSSRNSTYSYLQGVLSLPLDRRSDLEFSPAATTSGNYLTLAIASRWVASLAYVCPIDPLASEREVPELERMLLSISEHRGPVPTVQDLPAWLFQKIVADWWKGCPIQLTADEPEIPFRIVKATDFKCSAFTHMVVAQSPQYTPESADSLLPIIERYFRPV